MDYMVHFLPWGKLVLNLLKELYKNNWQFTKEDIKAFKTPFSSKKIHLKKVLCFTYKIIKLKYNSQCWWEYFTNLYFSFGKQFSKMPPKAQKHLHIFFDPVFPTSRINRKKIYCIEMCIRAFLKTRNNP